MSVNVAAATLSAYQRWAPVYPPYAHNAFMRAEEKAMLGFLPQVAGRDVLDLACGSGRYTRQLALAGARGAVAMDLCMPMLAQAAARSRVCADMMHLPFLDRAFDLVVSGLAIGHADSLPAWMNEVARVLKPGGTLLYSDFHPDAVAAGHQRTFRDSDHQIGSVPHTCYSVDSQRAAADGAGLRIDRLHDVRVGVDLNEQSATLQPLYERWRGLAVVLIVRAHRPSA